MDGLVEGALRCLDEAAVALPNGAAGRASARIVRVPGSFELPQACALLGRQKAADGQTLYSGIAALGCLIRGETSHYEVLCHAVANSLAALSVDLAQPAGHVALSFGVLTCDEMQQAQARSSADRHNKGYEAVQALLGTISLEDAAR